jgi:UDP-2,3-diacylglucosamine pyrophosphatase LpxH
MVSDLHLGDGSRSDAFMGKDRLLLQLLDRVADEGARLVICGDAFDFLQAHDFTPVIKAHGRLLRRLGELAAKSGVWYLHGNHDHDMHVYSDLLRFEVGARLWIGDEVIVQHGHQFDPWIGEDVKAAGLATRLHHGLEHHLGIWFRLPVHDFYSGWGRLLLWIAHKAWVLSRYRNRIYRLLGLEQWASRSDEFFNYWAQNDAGNPMRMTMPAMQYGRTRGARAVVCGHTHMPGNFEHEGIRFVNTGSWTFQWAQAVRYAEGKFECRDLISGRVYENHLYRPLLDGDLDQLTFGRWWRNQYMGWFRWRNAENRRRFGSAM